jgi:hypothetical protein
LQSLVSGGKRFPVICAYSEAAPSRDDREHTEGDI